MNKSNCVGCKYNFYNMERDGCWHLEDAKVITRYRIDMDSPTNVRANWQRIRKPNCFYGGGYSGDHYAYYDTLPDYVK